MCACTCFCMWKTDYRHHHPYLPPPLSIRDLGSVSTSVALELSSMTRPLHYSRLLGPGLLPSSPISGGVEAIPTTIRLHLFSQAIWRLFTLSEPILCSWPKTDPRLMSCPEILSTNASAQLLDKMHLIRVRHNMLKWNILLLKPVLIIILCAADLEKVKKKKK